MCSTFWLHSHVAAVKHNTETSFTSLIRRLPSTCANVPGRSTVHSAHNEPTPACAAHVIIWHYWTIMSTVAVNSAFHTCKADSPVLKPAFKEFCIAQIHATAYIGATALYDQHANATVQRCWQDAAVLCSGPCHHMRCAHCFNLATMAVEGHV